MTSSTLWTERSTSSRGAGPDTVAAKRSSANTDWPMVAEGGTHALCHADRPSPERDVTAGRATGRTRRTTTGSGMSAIRRDSWPLVVGVDAGASWVRVAARRGERVRRVRVPANRVDDLGSFLSSLLRARGWDSAAALVVGSRGVWTSAERAAIARRLGRVARRVE